MIKVLQFFTGQLGQRQIREVLAHPGLELVGVVVHHIEKNGVDVGTLIGSPPVGVLATTDIDAALKIEADVVLFNGIEWKPELLAKILRAGKNVLTTWGAWYMKHEPEYELLESACQEGRSSLAAAGNMPGCVSEAMPLFASGFVNNVTKIITQERDAPITNESYAQLVEFEGVSKPPPTDPYDHPLIPLCTWAFRQPAYFMADLFGLKIDDFRCTDADWGLATEDYYLDGIKTWVRKGTVSGFRFEHTAFVEGKPWYIHRFEMVHDYKIGRGYRSSAEDPEFTIEVHGTPSIRLTLDTFGGKDSSDNVLEINANRLINMIPHIVAAEPGCRTIADMKFIHAGYARPDEIARSRYS